MTAIDKNITFTRQYTRLDPETDDAKTIDVLLDFNDRASYLQWRSWWRMLLIEQTTVARDAKKKRHSDDPTIRGLAQSVRERQRIIGYNLKVLRMASKRKAAASHRLAAEVVQA